MTSAEAERAVAESEKRVYDLGAGEMPPEERVYVTERYARELGLSDREIDGLRDEGDYVYDHGHIDYPYTSVVRLLFAHGGSRAPDPPPAIPVAARQHRPRARARGRSRRARSPGRSDDDPEPEPELAPAGRRR